MCIVYSDLFEDIFFHEDIFLLVARNEAFFSFSVAHIMHEIFSALF